MTKPKVVDADITDFVTFIETFGYGNGELAAELTKALATAVRATNNHGRKSTFGVRFTVEQVDDSLWGQLIIIPEITEKPARAARAGAYQTDVESGQISLL